MRATSKLRRFRSHILHRLRPSLTTQIALLGISGVLIISATCLAGLDYAAWVQRDSDDSTRFEAALAALSDGFLESQQITTRFLRSHDEALIKQHSDLIEKGSAKYPLAKVETPH